MVDTSILVIIYNRSDLLEETPMTICELEYQLCVANQIRRCNVPESIVSDNV